MEPWLIVAAALGLGELVILLMLVRARRRIQILESGQSNWHRRITGVHKKIDDSLANLNSKPRRR